MPMQGQYNSCGLQLARWIGLVAILNSEGYGERGWLAHARRLHCCAAAAPYITAFSSHHTPRDILLDGWI